MIMSKEKSILSLTALVLLTVFVSVCSPREVYAARKRQLIAVETNTVDDTVVQTAKRIKKGKTDVSLNGLFGWCRFTAPKSRDYVFSFDMISKKDTRAYVYFKSPENDRLYGVTNLDLNTDHMFLCSPLHWKNMFHEDEDSNILDDPTQYRPSNSIKMRLEKGQTIYIRIGSNERTARIRVTVSDKRRKKSDNAIRKMFKKSSVKKFFQKEVTLGKIQFIKVYNSTLYSYFLNLCLKADVICEPIVYVNPYTGYSCYVDSLDGMSEKHLVRYLW